MVKMKYLNPKFEILTKFDGHELERIERVARVCYKSEDRITTGSARKIIANLIKNGHEAMLEHSQLSVLFTVDRGVSHELVRHRVASFAQESTRYVNYSKDKQDNQCKCINIKHALEMDTKIRKSKGQDVSKVDIGKILAIWQKAMEQSEQNYMDMIAAGASPQFARSVLTNSCKTEIVITTNYREWRHFFSLRTEAPAHPQMREVTIPLIFALRDKLPGIFDDIIEKNQLGIYNLEEKIVFKYDENGAVRAVDHEDSDGISIVSGVSYDFGTKNESFKKVAFELRNMGIKNWREPLRIYNPIVARLDPYSDSLSDEEKRLIMQECAVNVFYYLREILYIKQPGTGVPIPFELTIPVYQYIICCLNNRDTMVCGDRITRKTITIDSMLSWNFLFGSIKKKIIGVESTTSMNVIKTLKHKFVYPSFISLTSDDIASKHTVSELYKMEVMNSISTIPTPKTILDANMLGRSLNSDIVYISNIDCMDGGFSLLSGCLPVREIVKKNNQDGYSYTTCEYTNDALSGKALSKGRLESIHCLEEFIKNCEKWDDRWYDNPKDFKDINRFVVIDMNKK